MKTPALASLAGITIRHLQRLMTEGAVPCVTRSASGRWVIPDSDEVRKWAEGFQRWDGKPVPIRTHKPIAPIKPRVKLPKAKDTLDCVLRHRQAVDEARRAIELADGEARRLGAILSDEARRIRGSAWTAHLAELGLSRSDARRLMNLADLKREAMDMPKLKRLGIVEAGAGHAPRKARAARGDNWVGWVGGAAGSIREMIQFRPLDEWQREEREAVADQLKPLVELHKRLERGR